MPDEINTKLDNALKGIKGIQDIADRNKEKLDSLDKEQIDRINTDVTKHIEEINTIKAKQEEMEKYSEKLETLICNINRSSSEGNDESQKMCRDEFTNFLRKGTPLSTESSSLIADSIIEKSFIGVSQEKKEMYKKDLQVQVDPDGGYFVRPEISSEVLTRIFETSPVRQFASVETIASDAIEHPIDDNELDGGWVGESESRSDTNTPQVGTLTIYAHELYAQPRATQKMLDDAGFDLEAWLSKKISKKFTRLENNAFVVGSGSKQPKGFLTYDAWTTPGDYERGKLEYLTSIGTGVLEGDDIKILQNLLIEDYQPGAIFAMNRKTFGLVARLKDNEDRYLLDVHSLKTGDTKILLGAQVAFMHDMPEVANLAKAIVYGNFNDGYTVVDRVGIRVIRDIYTAKPFIKYYTTKRTGGAVTNYDSLKVLQIKN